MQQQVFFDWFIKRQMVISFFLFDLAYVDVARIFVAIGGTKQYKRLKKLQYNSLYTLYYLFIWKRKLDDPLRIVGSHN